MRANPVLSGNDSPRGADAETQVSIL